MMTSTNRGGLSRATKPGFSQSIEGCLEGAIGEHGLSQAQLQPFLDKAGASLETLKQQYADKSLPLLSIVSAREDIDAAAGALERLSKGAELMVFFGTGGSSLGGQTFAQIAGWNIPGVGMMRKAGRPRTRFYDNLDPDTLQSALEGMDLAKTRFVVISKSGGTAETLSQTIAALTMVRQAGLGDKIAQLFLGITEPDSPGSSNGLRALLSSLGVPMLEHDTGIGGRYSCLTNVGLIVALSRGMDAHLIREGARDVIDQMMGASSAVKFAPALGASVAIALNKQKGVGTAVMMPYADKLAHFGKWYSQLWAESLGKGGEGTSPIPALGPLDQHSQLQLLMDGPRDHFITIVRLDTGGLGPQIDPELAKTAGLDYLVGRTVGDIVNAQAQAMPKALAQAGRPVRLIDIARLDERVIGALMMHFMIETIIAGGILGLDPFDQPAVELAKVLTRETLARG